MPHTPATVMVGGMILVAGTATVLSASDKPPAACAARQTMPNQLRPWDCCAAAIATNGVTRSIATQDSSVRHVRAIEPRILSLIDTGLSGSVTFRGLIATLNASDVIVYIEPKVTRPALGGYLSHNIVAEGHYRYLRIASEISGSEPRLVSLLAHELQHAVEVAQAPDARDPESLERMFSRIAIKFGCGGTTCYESQAAKDVEHMVGEELKTYRATTRPPPCPPRSQPAPPVYRARWSRTETARSCLIRYRCLKRDAFGKQAVSN
jgi:hypothetical protein